MSERKNGSCLFSILIPLVLAILLFGVVQGPGTPEYEAAKVRKEAGIAPEPPSADRPNSFGGGMIIGIPLAILILVKSRRPVLVCAITWAIMLIYMAMHP